MCGQGNGLPLNFLMSLPPYIKQAEVEQLVKVFMMEKTKQVSLDEIKAFALAIPHVSWKVERIRRLSSALSTEEGSSTDNGIPEQVTSLFPKKFEKSCRDIDLLMPAFLSFHIQTSKTQNKKTTSTTKPSPPAVAFKMTSARSFSRRESSTGTGKVAFSSSVPAMRRSRSRISSYACMSDSASAGARPPLPRKSSSKTIPVAVPLHSKVSLPITPNPSLVNVRSCTCMR